MLVFGITADVALEKGKELINYCEGIRRVMEKWEKVSFECPLERVDI